jgi:uncharacterized membrane protein
MTTPNQHQRKEKTPTPKNEIGEALHPTKRTLFKSKRTEKEGEEKNRSSTQAKGERREKSSLTTQENFWCKQK